VIRRTVWRAGAGAGAVGGVAGVAGALAWRRHLAGLVPEWGGELLRARTDDGWNLGVRRYQVPEGADRRGVVVAGHGFAGSSLIWDLTPATSLARWLSERGWELFAVDLRGRGGSWPDSGPSKELQWCFEDVVRHDIPAAVELARATAGVDEVAWIGLEMSGQAIYAALVEGTVPAVRAAVTLGSPVLTPPEAKVPGVSSPPMLRRGGRVLFRPGAHHFGPILAALRSQQLASSFRPENVDPLVPARYLAHGVPDESVVLADQFRDWLDHAIMRSRDGGTVWSDRLGEIQVPLLLLAAAADLQRPPASVRDSVHLFSGTSAQFVEVGRAEGFALDYGHDDLVAARTSPREVFPLIEAWLADPGQEVGSPTPV
jgi:pimeloyl-ACP methyl ester carboxylesterase